MGIDEFASLEVDVRDFKSALGCFVTGVTVATTLSALGMHGVTANAVMSVSLEPPLVVLSIQTGSRMDVVLRQSDNYALSVLSSTQRDVAEYFADSSKPHDSAAFQRFPYSRARTGAPLLDDALAHVECRIVDTHPAGDHILYVGHAVFVASPKPGAPLRYFRGEMS
jgi:flavin reductase (DIM6/NTAB) family NADH-FMN oxidoreductase RutF